MGSSWSFLLTYKPCQRHHFFFFLHDQSTNATHFPKVLEAAPGPGGNAATSVPVVQERAPVLTAFDINEADTQARPVPCFVCPSLTSQQSFANLHRHFRLSGPHITLSRSLAF